jgi:hypothetical protein
LHRWSEIAFVPRQPFAVTKYDDEDGPDGARERGLHEQENVVQKRLDHFFNGGMKLGGSRLGCSA